MRAVLLLCVASACSAPTGPYCAQHVDDDGGLIAGEGTALCRELREQPVCDTPGETARFERDGLGTRLVGGTYALCDDALHVVCPDRAVAPRCLAPPPD